MKIDKKREAAHKEIAKWLGFPVSEIRRLNKNVPTAEVVAKAAYLKKNS